MLEHKADFRTSDQKISKALQKFVPYTQTALSASTVPASSTAFYCTKRNNDVQVLNLVPPGVTWGDIEARARASLQESGLPVHYRPTSQTVETKPPNDDLYSRLSQKRRPTGETSLNSIGIHAECLSGKSSARCCRVIQPALWCTRQQDLRYEYGYGLAHGRAGPGIVDPPSLERGHTSRAATPHGCSGSDSDCVMHKT